jgi:hypothetical protein
MPAIFSAAWRRIARLAKIRSSTPSCPHIGQRKTPHILQVTYRPDILGSSLDGASYVKFKKRSSGSVLSRDREGAVLFEYVTIFMEPCSKQECPGS